MKSARSNVEKVRVRNSAEGLVVLDDTSLVVPIRRVLIDNGANLWRNIEGWLEYVWVFLRLTHSYL